MADIFRAPIFGVKPPKWRSKQAPEFNLLETTLVDPFWGTEGSKRKDFQTQWRRNLSVEFQSFAVQNQMPFQNFEIHSRPGSYTNIRAQLYPDLLLTTLAPVGGGNSSWLRVTVRGATRRGGG